MGFQKFETVSGVKSFLDDAAICFYHYDFSKDLHLNIIFFIADLKGAM